MQKKFISILLILIFDSTKVQSLDLLEEMLNEMKQINQKVDLLNEKADNNKKIFETFQEEVRQNFTNMDSGFEMTREDIRSVKSELNSLQHDMKAIKTFEENIKINSDIIKNEIPAVKENFLTLNSNIGKIEQEVIKTKEELKISSDKTFDKVEPMRDEMIRSFEYQVKSLNHTIEERYAIITKENSEILKTSFDDIFSKAEPKIDEIKRSLESVDDQVKSLNHTIQENSSKVTSIENSVTNMEILMRSLDYGK